MDEFYQRRLFVKKWFTFKEKGIDIQFKDNDGDFSLFIAYDKIGPRDEVRIFHKKRKVIWRLGIGLSLLTLFKGIVSIGTDERAFFSALATAAIVAAIFYGYYYFTTEKYFAIPLSTGRYFQVFYNTPSVAASEAFVDAVYERRDAYMRSEGFFDDDENVDRGE